MTGKYRVLLSAAALLLAGAGVLLFCSHDDGAAPIQASRPAEAASAADIPLSEPSVREEEISPEAQPSEQDDAQPQTEEEKAAAAEEAKVEAFDNITDKWMEPSKKGVTMADVDAFVKTFREVPKDRQDECVHRALNLVPDENVMLLAGILMDKTMDKEIVETVFNDILNRDEDVKKPIMLQIHKDKTHPCWADVAWILDVTGEKKD